MSSGDPIWRQCVAWLNRFRLVPATSCALSPQVRPDDGNTLNKSVLFAAPNIRWPNVSWPTRWHLMENFLLWHILYWQFNWDCTSIPYTESSLHLYENLRFPKNMEADLLRPTWSFKLGFKDSADLELSFETPGFQVNSKFQRRQRSNLV